MRTYLRFLFLLIIPVVLIAEHAYAQCPIAFPISRVGSYCALMPPYKISVYTQRGVTYRVYDGNFSTIGEVEGDGSNMQVPVTITKNQDIYRVVAYKTGCPSQDMLNTLDITLGLSIGKTAAPTGYTDICQNASTFTYTIPPTNNALSYTWSVSPPSAGSISSNGKSGLMSWNSGFSGTATIKVQADGCGSSFTFNTTSVTVKPSGSSSFALGGPKTATPGVSNIWAISPPIDNPDGYEWAIDPPGAGTISPIGNAASWKASATISTSFTGATATLKVRANGCNGPTPWKTYDIKIGPPIPPPVCINAYPMDDLLQGSPYCPSSTPKILAYTDAGVTYRVYNVNFTIAGEVVGTGRRMEIPITITHTGKSTFTVVGMKEGCGSKDMLNPVNITVGSEVGTPSLPAGPTQRCQQAGLSEYRTSAQNELDGYRWSVSPPGAGVFELGLKPTTTLLWEPSFSGTATITTTAFGCEGTNKSTSLSVQVIPKPATTLTPANPVIVCGSNCVNVAALPGLTYQWYDNGKLISEQTTQNISICKTGNYSLRLKDSNDCYSDLKEIPIHHDYEIDPSLICDYALNWIESTSLDENYEAYSNSKSYFNFSGEPLQTQSKNFTSGKIFGSQPLRDRFNRVVGSTLAAPVPYSDFKYHYNFLLNKSKVPYSSSDFDNADTKLTPLAIDQSTPGTVGWYYSSNNTAESNVPATDYPYSRTEFYDDGTGEVRRSASAGDQHRLGKGHEVLGGTFPVYNELDDYLTMRQGQVGIPDNVASLQNNAVQSVVRDQNGKYAINISDRSGKTVMTAQKGTPGDYTLKVLNKIDIDARIVPKTPAFPLLVYFYILDAQEVTLQVNGTYIIEDIVNNISYASPAEVPKAQGEKWLPGFYRIRVLTGVMFTLAYSNYFKDVSYQFYDDAGRLKSSVSPNGYVQLKKNPDPVPFADIDKTTYQYNHQGWLLSMTEPDAGTTRYKYRKDGKIRFSQNAQQLVNETNGLAGKGKFSYTNYDALGRPYESGEYRGTQTFSSTSAQVEFDAQIQYAAGDKKDWVRTYYDVPDADFQTTTGLSSGYVQNFVRSSVSHTLNANMHTWYSYDEMGRVTWMVQKPTALPRVFAVTYAYDFLGNVRTVSNLSYNTTGTLLDQFYHHYEYDKDKRLSKAYTSLDGSHTQLRATYQYYLHGPLKRIELADKLQGIDFVYNIHGWLTQINHPDNTKDPGHDGAGNGVKDDVFGMVLDYYQSDLGNLLISDAAGSIHNPMQRHHLPFEPADSYTLHQPLIRFSSPFGEREESINTPLFKEFSVQNPKYKKMMEEVREN